ncbi:Tfp pilus assembly protein FimT/FimU [Glaesserella sp.]|uniref:pilus assembly FimT family protein n=1 Tax=Glaesserella sp. TaxID=2094731 RepID=UPI00359F1F97
MFRAVTLIELLVTLALVVISFYFISPVLFRIQEHILITHEIDQIKTFVYQVQSRARYSKKNYSFTISQQEQEKNWCIIAIEKIDNRQIICDCLNISGCHIQTGYYLYQASNNQLLLKNNSLYPKAFIDIDGKSARLSPKCLEISSNSVREILQFDQNGVVNVVQDGKRSSCK